MTARSRVKLFVGAAIIAGAVCGFLGESVHNKIIFGFGAVIALIGALFARLGLYRESYSNLLLNNGISKAPLSKSQRRLVFSIGTFLLACTLLSLAISVSMGGGNIAVLLFLVGFASMLALVVYAGIVFLLPW
jgi:hypothetical protein